VLDRHYRIQRVLALAGGGVTYLGRALGPDDAEEGPDLAIKLLYAHRDAGEHLIRLANEAQVLRHLAHPHIVVGYGFVHRHGAPPYLVTRFERGGTLHDHLARVGPLRPDVAAAATRQVVLALQQAHLRGVVHRDLKPQNVLLEAPCAREEVPALRVADFGIAKIQGTLADGMTRVGAFVGTPEFAAPEQFMGRPPTAATDLYAVGALFYALLLGRPAFVPRDRHDVVGALADLLASLPPQVPGPHTGAWRAAQDVLDGTMQAEPSLRADAPAVLALLDAVIAAGAAAAAEGASALCESHTLSPDDLAAPAPASPDTWVDSPTFTTLPAEPPPELSPAGGDGPAPPQDARTAEVLSEPPPAGGDGPALSLDDLLGSTPESPPETFPELFAARPRLAPVPRAAPAPVPRPAPRPAPRAAPTPTPSPRPSASSVPAAKPAPGLPWPAPAQPVVAPGPVPASMAGRAELLGALDLTPHLSEARALVEAMNADARALTALAAAYRSGDPPARGVGLCRFAALGGRTDWTSRLRGLLADADASVRAAAALALGHVGTVAALSALAACARDPAPEVRAALGHALGALAVRARRPDLARPTLEVLARDADAKVRAGADAGLATLEATC
jgi:serine/threonine protein kinase